MGCEQLGLLVAPCGNSADIPAGIANWDCALDVVLLDPGGHCPEMDNQGRPDELPQGNWECPLDITAAWLQSSKSELLKRSTRRE